VKVDITLGEVNIIEIEERASTRIVHYTINNEVKSAVLKTFQNISDWANDNFNNIKKI